LLITYKDKNWKVDREMSVSEMLEEIGLADAHLLVFVDGKLARDDNKVSSESSVKLYDVVTGG